MKNSKNFLKLGIALLGVATLGLAPYLPEPHIWKQILNIKNGTFTQPIDWFDMLLHSAPWFYLIWVIKGFLKKKPGDEGSADQN